MIDGVSVRASAANSGVRRWFSLLAAQHSPASLSSAMRRRALSHPPKVEDQPPSPLTPGGERVSVARWPRAPPPTPANLAHPMISRRTRTAAPRELADQLRTVARAVLPRAAARAQVAPRMEAFPAWAALP